jgi:hypothetical protein
MGSGCAGWVECRATRSEHPRPSPRFAPLAKLHRMRAQRQFCMTRNSCEMTMLTRTFMPLLLAVALAACAPRADLDKATAEVARLKEEVSSLNRLNEEQRSRIASLEKQLARKPQLPVKVSLRRAYLGSGHVAVFATTVKEDFPILVTVKSKALGTTQQFRVNLSATTASELGRSEGASIDPADELTLENQNYETSVVRFNPR